LSRARIAFVRTAALAALALGLMAAACSRPPVLTDSLRERYALGEADLRRVQLFTSDEIMLRREASAEERSIGGAELRVRGGVYEEEIVIPAKTPCVALRTEGTYVLVGFTPQHPELSLWFALDTKSDPSAEGRRYLLAPIANAYDAPSPLVPETSKGFLVTYGGRKYRVADARSWSSHLLVDLEESFRKNRVRQEPPGWKLEETPGGSVRVKVATPAPSASPRDAGVDAP
jgi:hypothetical protein